MVGGSEKNEINAILNSKLKLELVEVGVELGNISQGKNIDRKRESDKDSLGDDEESFSDSCEHESDEYDTIEGFDFKMLTNVTKMIETQYHLKALPSNSSSEASLNEDSSENQESDSEDNFHPELFGLLEDPGVVRFDCVDYPLSVIKHSDEKDQGDAIRKEDDDLILDHKIQIAQCERNILSKSLDNLLPSLDIVPNMRCNCNPSYHISR